MKFFISQWSIFHLFDNKTIDGRRQPIINYVNYEQMYVRRTYVQSTARGTTQNCQITLIDFNFINFTLKHFVTRLVMLLSVRIRERVDKKKCGEKFFQA
jgi:hypothetical protein